jgi:hypothetical protein
MPACLISFEELVRNRAEEENRLEALARLYARKEAVDDLIKSLENYQRARFSKKASCIPFTMSASCS